MSYLWQNWLFTSEKNGQLHMEADCDQFQQIPTAHNIVIIILYHLHSEVLVVIELKPALFYLQTNTFPIYCLICPPISVVLTPFQTAAPFATT